jgi:hypothetical protein
MKGDEKGKPHISIPQKSAVAIVPPKKVRTFAYRHMLPSSATPPLSRPAGLLARISRTLTLWVSNRLFGRCTIMLGRIPKS